MYERQEKHLCPSGKINNSETVESRLTAQDADNLRFPQSWRMRSCRVITEEEIIVQVFTVLHPSKILGFYKVVGSLKLWYEWDSK